MFKTTKHHMNYWKNRKIDFEAAYFTPDHPHRLLIAEKLRYMPFGSLYEIGCGAGANLALIKRYWPNAQLGGLDINPEAIVVAKKKLPEYTSFFNVGAADYLFPGNQGTDIVLTDACLIYIAPDRINAVMAEIKRVTRKAVIFIEFHVRGLWPRLKLQLQSGYWAYDYQKLLERHDFYDIEITKVPEKAWPGDKYPRYIIMAKAP